MYCLLRAMAMSNPLLPEPDLPTRRRSIPSWAPAFQIRHRQFGAGSGDTGDLPLIVAEAKAQLAREIEEERTRETTKDRARGERFD